MAEGRKRGEGGDVTKTKPPCIPGRHRHRWTLTQWNPERKDATEVCERCGTTRHLTEWFSVRGYEEAK